ncbi:MAG: STAS domain-containing protein [Chromatiaceae bacterium]|jgi:anti-anti-sigma factor|nr:STAS domain-containing protein [Chromatiaceae bacterium]
MHISEQRKEGVLILGPEGRLDTNTSEPFEQRMMAVIDAGNNRLVVDLTELDYISSAGLRVLLMSAKRLKNEQGRLALCGLKSHIREVFEISGFLKILTVVENTDAAVAAVVD